MVCLIIIWGLVIYANSLKGEFIWDDNGLIKNNVYLRDVKNIPGFFTRDMGLGSSVKSNFYRPLQMSVNMLNYSLWGLNERGYHLVSVGLHIIAGLCLFWLVCILFSDKLLASLTAVLFVAHPAHTEAIDYIAGVSDPMSALFMLLSLVFYAKSVYSNKLKLFILSLLNFIFALLAKENSIILPFLLLLINYILKKKIKISYFLSFAVILILYIVLRINIVGFVPPSLPSLAGLFVRIPSFFAAISEYARILFLPFDLRLQYSNKTFGFFDTKVLIGMAVLSVVVVISYLRRKNDRLMFFSAFWFFICLLPVSNIFVISYPFMMEHWVYFSSCGFFLFIGHLAVNYLRTRKLRILAGIVVAGMVIIWSVLTIRQHRYWRNPAALYQRAIKYDPDNWLFYNGLALAFQDKGKNSEAVEAYKKAISINQNESKLYYNLSSLYQSMGRQEEAIVSYKQGREIDVKSAQYYYEACKKYLEAGKSAEAVGSFNRALELAPNNISVYLELGNTYIIAGKYKDAIALLKKVLKIAPNLSVAYNNLAAAYYYGKQYDLAIENCNKAIGLGYKVAPVFLELLRPYKK
ncbi:MAG: tetratricopeptide repeat protein [Candidatus Omnitrophota bacterium]